MAAITERRTVTMGFDELLRNLLAAYASAACGNAL